MKQLFSEGILSNPSTQIEEEKKFWLIPTSMWINYVIKRSLLNILTHWAKPVQEDRDENGSPLLTEWCSWHKPVFEILPTYGIISMQISMRTKTTSSWATIKILEVLRVLNIFSKRLFFFLKSKIVGVIWGYIGYTPCSRRLPSRNVLKHSESLFLVVLHFDSEILFSFVLFFFFFFGLIFVPHLRRP